MLRCSRAPGSPAINGLRDSEMLAPANRTKLTDLNQRLTMHVDGKNNKEIWAGTQYEMRKIIGLV